MSHFRYNRLAVLLAAIVLLVSAVGCNMPKANPPAATDTAPQATLPPDTGVTETPAVQPVDTIAVANTDAAPTTAIVHTDIPGNPPANNLSELTDRDSSVFAANKRANGGDSVAANLYERPFNANTMDTYFPDLDILKARLFSADPWIYVNMALQSQSAAGGFSGVYGVELDLNVDGRGDVLIMASNPTANWSTDGVKAWTDANHDVGGAHPIGPDAPKSGDGYETLVFDQGVGTDPDAAWVRRSPDYPNSLQFAFKQSLINDDGDFTWGVWAVSPQTFNPAWFDYNDHFTAEEMGSPLVEMSKYYPLKAFAEVDNTCRWAVGFAPTGSEPGICPVPATPTPIRPGTISGRVFDDGINGDEVFDPLSVPLVNYAVEIHANDCSGSLVATINTDAFGYYTVTVQPGTYCVKTTTAYRTRGGAPKTVTVGNGGSAVANFGFWDYLGIQ